MLVLVAFAFVAGAATAVSPCVLPVLPAVLSAGATGGRRRPLGVVLGLALTFTVTIVGLASVVDQVGLGPSVTRTIAIVFLLGFGIAVAVPRIGDPIEARLSRIAALGGGRGRIRGDGFVSGLGVGGALGFVYAPCAGPILAAVIAVSAASGRTVAVGAAYALGSAAVLFALALGGRRVLGSLRGARAATVQRVLGAVMVVTALAMAFDLDIRFQTAIANHLPDAVVNPAKPLEDSAAARRRIADLNGTPKFAERTTPARRPGSHARLPVLGTAPDFTGNQRWFNTPGSRPLTLAGLRGRVVLVDFWTYTCINCIRTLPYVKAWDRRYRDAGLTIVGVHSPEFSFEKDAGNVQAAIRQNGLRYAVAQDNDLKTWTAWGNQFWPAKYLIDARGRVRYAHFGEGDYGKTEAAIRALLAERGEANLGRRARVSGAITPSDEATPETYLGAARADRFLPGNPTRGTRDYGRAPGKLPLSHFALSGIWRVDGESAAAVRDARIDATVRAKDVYLVLSSQGEVPRRVAVALDGRPSAAGGVMVRRQRLYRLAGLPRVSTHHLTLRFPPGVSGFAFTFG
jgi:cytochrome c biogenesis protein CcdA/thiol-disulfide isomerase/thioredoxin